ncbi:hypothetical protein ACIBCM_12640 [Streptomyces sp. NPDC051018]|uniref:hypothetical protein n=1 Tax=Streptomyces sp. NPDC051018 TaxID=3365639 RepID=UPI00378A7EED
MSIRLTEINLSSGRSIELSDLHLSTTYGGVLEGYPYKEFNDRKLTRLIESTEKRRPHHAVHLITPPRELPDTSAGRRGPVELLPAVTCVGLFTSGPIDPACDLSMLTVIWFQPTAEVPTTSTADPGLLTLDWEALAKDGDY